MNIIKKNYHWIIVAVLLVELAVHLGILNNISGLYIIPVTEELGISRGSFSWAYSIRSLIAFFSTLFSGFIFSKYGFRKLATIFLLITAVSYALLGSSQNALMLAVASALMGTGEGFCSTAAATRMVNTWFHKNQGLILGLVTASTGLGGSLFSIILSKSIETDGWRFSYYMCGILYKHIVSTIVNTCMITLCGIAHYGRMAQNIVVARTLLAVEILSKCGVGYATLQHDIAFVVH